MAIGPASKKDQSESERGGCEWELIARAVGRSDESIVEVNFPDGDDQVDADGAAAGRVKNPARIIKPPRNSVKDDT